jgi:hypothetical protein
MTKILIQAVPWRKDRAKTAKSLKKQTKGEIVWDEKHDNLYTFLTVLEAAGEDAFILLEDDIELTSDFVEKAEAVINSHRTEVINFFSVGLIMDGKLPGGTFQYTQAVYFPPGAAQALIEFTRTWQSRRNDQDKLISDWLSRTRQDYWLHKPSLVQHLGYDSATEETRSTDRQSPSYEA